MPAFGFTEARSDTASLTAARNITSGLPWRLEADPSSAHEPTGDTRPQTEWAPTDCVLVIEKVIDARKEGELFRKRVVSRKIKDYAVINPIIPASAAMRG